MSLDQSKYIFEIICKKKTPKNPTRSQNYEKAPKKKEEKNISFGSLKTNIELPIQRWWFKSTLKLRTDFFLLLVVFL